MSDKNRLLGFVTLEKGEYPFEFDKTSFKLKIYLKESDEVIDNLFNALRWQFDEDEHEHRWINTVELKGQSVDGDHLLFGTLANPDNDHGFLTYDINWLFLSENDDFKYQEAVIRGQEINWFYHPSSIYKIENTEDIEKKYNTVEHTKISLSEAQSINCGSYTYDNTTIDISLKIYGKLYFLSKQPFDSFTTLVLHFDKKTDSNFTKDRIFTATQFLRYITYRSNISINTVNLYNYDGEKRTFAGKFMVPPTDSESHPKVSTRIINYPCLGDKTAIIFEKIESKQLRLSHLCKSIKETNNYSFARIIMILSRFERESENIYENISPSITSEEMKELAIKALNDLIISQNITGKHKKKLKSIIHAISHSGISESDRILYVLKDCRPVMESIISEFYKKNYDDEIEQLSERLNYVRNGIAHDKDNWSFEAVNLSDIKVIERLLYAMRLKEIGIDNSSIKDALGRLFS